MNNQSSILQDDSHGGQRGVPSSSPGLTPNPSNHTNQPNEPNISNYSSLLSTVSDLTNDLEKALSKLQKYETQNQLLYNTNSILKDELQDIRVKYTEVKDLYSDLTVRKSESDKNYEDFLYKIKLQLHEKTKEFELQREKFKPQDLDSIRMKIQEELELGHAIKLKNMNGQIEQYQDLYINMKHEYDLCKIEYSTKYELYEKQINELQNKYDSLCNHMNEKMKIWADNRYVIEKEEVIRNQSMKVHELQCMIDTMKDECQVYHQKYNNSIKDTEINKSKYMIMISELQGHVRSIDSEKYNLEERIKFLGIDNERKDQIIKNMKIQIEDLQEKYDIVQNDMNDMIYNHNNEKENYIKDKNNIESLYNNNIIKLNDNNQILNEKLNEREDSIRRYQKQINELQLRLESNDRELRRIHQNQIQESNKKYILLETDYMNTKKELQNDLNQKNNMVEHIRLENNAYKSDIMRLKREKEILYEKMRESERKQQQMSILENTINEYKQKEIKLQNNLYHSNNKLKEIEKLYENMIVKYDTMKRDNEAFIESIQNDIKVKVNTIKSTYIVKIDELKKNIKEYKDKFNMIENQLMKEKKKSELYKEKALRVYHENKLLAGIVHDT